MKIINCKVKILCLQDTLICFQLLMARKQHIYLLYSAVEDKERWIVWLQDYVRNTCTRYCFLMPFTCLEIIVTLFKTPVQNTQSNIGTNKLLACSNKTKSPRIFSMEKLAVTCKKQEQHAITSTKVWTFSFFRRKSVFVSLGAMPYLTNQEEAREKKKSANNSLYSLVRYVQLRHWYVRPWRH